MFFTISEATGIKSSNASDAASAESMRSDFIVSPICKSWRGEMTVFERWEYGDPCTVAINREQAAKRRQKRRQPEPERFQPCDGCRHLRFELERQFCDMGKKKFIRCILFQKKD